jgi:hypothetical protein
MAKQASIVMVGRGWAWSGRRGRDWLGAVGPGLARQAGHGEAGRSTARQGSVWHSKAGTARYGGAW